MLKKIIILSFILACSFDAFAQSTSDLPLVTVTGEADIRVVPNELVLNLEVVTSGKDIEIVKKLNDESVKQVVLLAQSYQISPLDIQTDHLEIQPKYTAGYDKKGPVFLGYEMTKGVRLRLRDVSKTESLLSDVIKAGVNRVRGVSFNHSELRKYKDDARAMAIKAAREKAVAFAGEIGQKIGKAFSINEGGRGNNFTIDGSASNDSRIVLPDEKSAISLGVLTISARVEVRFILE